MHRFESTASTTLAPASLERPPANAERIARDVFDRFQGWTAISSLALIAVTWKLWTPQRVYPQVPVFASLCEAPGWLDWCALGAVLTGLLALLFTKRSLVSSLASALVLAGLVLLFSLDQHRFQPWAYELALFCIVWLTCQEQLGLRLMRLLLIGIYFYSALGKFDFEFLHTVGQQMLSTITSWVGVDATQLPMGLRVWIVATFPLVELAIAMGLWWRRTRRFAGWLALGLHFGLVAILGPFGMNHRFGVLLWNIQVAGQVFWLFLAKQTATPEQAEVRLPTKISNWIGAAVIGAATILPITERVELWDHWPSWALYAPHSSRVQVEVSPAAWERLPESLQKLREMPLVEADEIALWIPVPIDAWSLEALDTPIYPQARFQLGVAEALVRKVQSDFQVRVTLLGTASRSTGARNRKTFTNLRQLTQAQSRYWVNTHPRNLAIVSLKIR